MEELIAIDINLSKVKNDETAYYRLTKEMKEFLKKCQEKNNIIGFTWDGSFNFGIILKNKKCKICRKDSKEEPECDSCQF